jgi:predicted dehydrogenase
VHDGDAVGDVVAVQGEYLSGGRWMNPRQPGWDDMTWQLRDWRYFSWLSGDFVACDAIATIDSMLWLMRDTPPARVSAAGGRTQRTGVAYGNVYDHFSATLQWPDGRHGQFACRQWNDSEQRVGAAAFGTTGVAELRPLGITIGGKRVWTGKRPDKMYELEQWSLLDSVRSRKPINDGDRLIRATTVALMIRASAYTGRTLFWDRASAVAAKAPGDAPVIWESAQDLTPAAYQFGPLPVAPVAVPGQTKFV